MVNAAIQIFLAIAIVIILCVIGFIVYDADQINAIRKSTVPQITTPIFKGIIDLKTTKDIEYNTLDSTDALNPNYVNLGDSYNQPGGAEFTYNFWLYVDKSKFTGGTPTNSEKTTTSRGSIGADKGLATDNIILLLRGDKIPKRYTNLCGDPKTDILVKCPLIKLENTPGTSSEMKADMLTVEFNTIQGPDAIQENSDDTCKQKSVSWSHVNSFKLSVTGLTSKPGIAGKWNMITVMIRDTYPNDPLPIRNKTRCTIYINGGIELDTYVDGKFAKGYSNNANPSIIKMNKGNLYIAPTVSGAYSLSNASAKGVMMADLTFYNYAIPTTTIKQLFASQFTKAYAPTPGTVSDKILDKVWMNNVSTNTSNNKTDVIN